MRLWLSELRKRQEHCFHSRWGLIQYCFPRSGRDYSTSIPQRELRAAAANILLNFPTWLMQYRQSIFVCVFLVDYVIFDQSPSVLPPTYMVRDVTTDVMDSGIPTKGGPRPDNTVVYKLFPSTTDAGQDELTHYAVRCTELASRLTAGHVWHYEPFRVGAWRTHCDDPPHLYGSTCYRDNIEDEWLIVYLLQEISQHLLQLVISVSDDDGELLLIEAAHHLPKWLKPETSQNRVFLHKGQLHIIPKPQTPAEVTLYPVATPTLQQAVQLVANSAIPTEASEAIQKAILDRITRFPGALRTNLHHTHCYLPWSAAHVLSCDPQLVAAAVHALCDRVSTDMQAVRAMHHFSPRQHVCVMAEVTFTRCLYAQLLHQRFSPPRNCGFSLPQANSPTYRSYDLGMKLACGLEILVCAVGGVRREGEEGKREDLSNNPRWTKFITTLKEKGYFQGEVEGSKLHQQLMSSAQDYFTDNILHHKEEGGAGGEGGGDNNGFRDPLEVAGNKIVHILTSNPGSEEEVKARFSSLPPPDDDSWLEISPEELDKMMRQAAGYLPQEQGPADRGCESDRGHEVESMVHGMKTFVDQVSSHKGAEFPWSADDTCEVQFDPEAVLSSLQAMLGVERGVGGGEAGESSDDTGSVDSEEDVASLLEAMDRELAATAVGKSFEKTEGPGAEGGGSVDVDYNLAKNLLESLSSQPEAAGPASNILRSLGIPIPTPSQNGTEAEEKET